MIIKKLHIKKFRHIIDTEIEFGENLTVIAGQNGTGKSSLLGWVAQLCDYKSKHNRLNGKPFKEKYSNVFKFCPNNDYQNKYEVEFHYMDSNFQPMKKNIKTRYVGKTDKFKERYRTDYDGRGSTLDFPIIYLGLKRLIPLATENKITIRPTTISSNYKNLFSKLSKEILILIEDNINPESIKSTNKNTFAMKTDTYGHLGNSAGQDNVGQIISAILSFMELKKLAKANYDGGILLIDEIDATLFVGAQLFLIQKLQNYAKSLSLQIIFTTHSLEIIEELSQKNNQGIVVNYLLLQNNKVINKINPSFEYISNKIKNQIKQTSKIIRKQFICEDNVAEYWAKNLLNGSDLKKMVSIGKGPFNDGMIIQMAKSKHKIFNDVGFILDGDVKQKNNIGSFSKTVFLPEKKPPEMVFYNFIKSLPDDDSFWDDDLNLTKQTCFGKYQSTGNGNAKKWFFDPKNKPFFGVSYSKLLNRWKKDNKEMVVKFQNDLSKVL